MPAIAPPKQQAVGLGALFESQKLKRRLIGHGLIAALLLCAGCCGCVFSPILARRALQAPNQQYSEPKELKRLVAVLATNFVAQRIPVGPPAAVLDLMVMEPGDFGVKIITTITPRREIHGKDKNQYDFNFQFGFQGFSHESKLGTNEICGTIFLLHGYGLNKETVLPWGLVLAKAGYRVVLVDLRGHGRSTGDRIYFGGVERWDLVQSLDALRQMGIIEGPVGVLGISYGAVMALQWASVDSRVQCVTAISPYTNPGAAVERFLETFVPALPWRLDRKVAGEVAKRLAMEWPDLATETALRRMKQPVLFVRGEHDELCTREDLGVLKASAPKGSEATEIPIANHLVVGMCINQLEGTVTEWFQRHLAG